MKAIPPILVIDSREQTPLVFVNFDSIGGTLATGDYSVVGFEDHFTIERKSLADAVASVTYDRARFEKELARMRGYEFCRVLIVGTEAEGNTNRNEVR